MSTEPPELKQSHLLVYVAKKLDDIHARIEAHDKRLNDIAETSRTMHKDFRTTSRRNDLITILAMAIKASWTFSAQLSMFFMAGYVAIEHQWYVQRVWEWLSRLFGA